MAYSTSSFAAWEATALAADSPLIGGQVIPVSPTKAFWTEVDFADTNATKTVATATDKTDSSYPARRLYDNQPDLPTRPTLLAGGILGEANQGGGLVRVQTDAAHGITDPGTTVTITGTTDYNGTFVVIAISDATHFDITDTWVNDNGANGDWVVSKWFFVFDFSAAGIEFDAVGTMGQNFNALSLTDVDFEIADDNTFDTNLVTAADFGAPSDDKRKLDLALDSDRYSAVRYARLELTGCTSLTVAPSINELLLIRRRQLKHKPRIPYDRTSLHDMNSLTTTGSGVTHKTTYYRRQFRLRAPVRMGEDTHINNLISWFQETENAFIWINNPNTAPNSWHLMTGSQNALVLPSAGWTERSTTLEGVEQGPEDYFLDKGLY